MAFIDSHREPSQRYGLLRVVGKLFAWIGIINLVLGSLLLCLALYVLAASPATAPTHPVPIRATAGLPLLGGLTSSVAVAVSLGFLALGFLVSGVQFLAIGALTRLAIHVEENTRATAQGLEKLCTRLEPREAAGAESWFVS